MSEPTTGSAIARFEKNSREEVRVSVDEFHGRKLINLRVYYKNEKGEWLPAKQGIAIGVDRYRDLADAVLQLGEWLQKHNLLPGAGK